MKIAHYEVVERLGAGGMGEVYRAMDPKLGRDVAIKVLPAAFLQNPDRRARFEREARVLASINHPHIGAIYGVEEADGYRALVLELVEGQTLAERIVASGPLPLEDALPIARQIAEALEAAHEKGIVHRDLKPANIMLTEAGAVKVVDFGLAKYGVAESSSALASSPTLTSAGTLEGVILGTAVYLSPEQARGRIIDKRSDIWAFGCVLYEMLTGRRVFGRETVSDSIAAILGEEPDWSALGGGVPERIVALLRRCLAKDPRRRLHDIADARIDIEDALASPPAATGAPRPPVAAPPAWRWLLPWALCAAAVTALIAVTALAWKSGGGRPVSDQETAVRFALALPGPVTFSPASSFVSFSPDGRYLAFVATNAAGQAAVWLRPSDALEARQLPGTEGARYTFWSPDSRHIGFFAPGGAIKRVGVAGDPPQMLSTGSLATPTGATWSPQGVILFSLLAGPIHRISASGGIPAVAVTSGDESKQLAHSFPCFLPDGKRFLYYKRSADAEQDGIYLRDLDQGQERLLIHASSMAIHVPGHLLYLREGALLAHPFDAISGTLSGDPIPIADGIDYFAESGNASFAASQTGALVYRSSAAASMNRLVWFDRTGRRLGELGEPGSYRNPRLSPDRSRVAVEKVDGSGNRDIWILDVASGLQVRFTFEPGRDAAPVWSSNGQYIAWQGTNAMFMKSADGKGGPQRLHGEPWIPDDWLAGTGLLFHPPAPREIFLMDPPRNLSSRKVIEGRAITTHARISPDGKWVAYSNADSGRAEIIIQDFPAASGRWQVSTTGGVQPVWRADGKMLFYLTPDGRLVEVPVTLGALVEIGKPQVLFRVQTEFMSGFIWHQYDASADGQRFLVNTTEVVTSPVTVVYNWPALLRNRR